MANLQVGCSYDKDAAFAGAVDKVAVEYGGSFAVPLHYLPVVGQKVYVVIESTPGESETSVTVAAPVTLTLEGIWVDGDVQVADTAITIGQGKIVRAVVSYTGYIDYNAVSADVSITFA